MNRNWVAGIVLTVLTCATARAADDQQEPATDVPELQPLSQYAGNWQVELTIKNMEHPDGVKTTGSSVGEWIHGGRFLRQTWSVNAADGIPAFNGSSIRTYDPRKMTYRTWSFDSTGNAEESQGLWDPQKRTLTWKILENNSGGMTIVTSTFAQDGMETWSILAKDSNGTVLADVNGKATRRASTE
jgi:hypothetical protein